MQHTPPTTPQTLPSPSSVGDATPTPQTPSKKRSLESCAAEFVEKGWKLVEEVNPKSREWVRLKVSKVILSKVIKMLTLFVLLSEDAFFKMLNNVVINQLV